MRAGQTITFFILVIFCAAIYFTDNARGQSSSVELVIGVRSDAAPFSYRRNEPDILGQPLQEGVLRRQKFDGYVVNICDRVLSELSAIYRSRLSLRVETVDAASRFPMLRQHKIDILCDPATITPDRLATFIASMPLYLSGISFAAQRIAEFKNLRCRPVVGFVGETTAQTSGVQRILEAGEWPKYSKSLWAFINNQKATSLYSANCPAASAPIQAYKTHNALAEAFCNQEVLYYVGDIEIITRKLGAIKGCDDHRGASQTYSDERYAIFLNAKEAKAEKAFFLLKFMEILSRRILSADSLLLESFNQSFPGYRASQKLELFYWSLIGRYPHDSKDK